MSSCKKEKEKLYAIHEEVKIWGNILEYVRYGPVSF